MKNFNAKRIESSTTSIFSTISKLAGENKAVNLGQGFPDFNGPDWLMEYAFNAMKQGKNQYAPAQGIFSLRESLSFLYTHFYDINFNPESNITITSGATEALFSSIFAFINEGDEVIMFEPVYDSHLADVIMAGGVPRYVTLKKPDFNFDFDELEQAISPKTKMIILNNPHNPTGKVFTLDELNYIAKLAIKHDILVLSDEVYEFITFDNNKHIPIASINGMQDRTITISSAGKTFSVTGWKIGWALASDKLSNAIGKVHQWTTFAINTPCQHAVAQGIKQLDDYLPEFRKMYIEKRNLMYDNLLHTNFKPHKTQGSFFMMADLPLNSNIDDFQMAIDLIRINKVATIPTSVFYGKSDEGKSMLRLCFAKDNKTIIDGVENMKSFAV